jgi:hypothetical protein
MRRSKAKAQLLSCSTTHGAFAIDAQAIHNTVGSFRTSLVVSTVHQVCDLQNLVTGDCMEYKIDLAQLNGTSNQ